MATVPDGLSSTFSKGLSLLIKGAYFVARIWKFESFSFLNVTLTLTVQPVCDASVI